MNIDLSTWPLVDLRQVRSSLREVPLELYPELTGYTRESIHQGLGGQGGLFLASDMAKLLRLRKDMRVLDLGCGWGTTSVFLAKEFQVQVIAVDEDPSPSLARTAATAGVADSIQFIQADARKLPFPPAHFDAVFAMNSFFYFGADETYPPYLFDLLKPGGQIVIGSPCYAAELTPDTPAEFLLEYPACLSVHSPAWWRTYFERTGQVDVTHAELHPHGVLFWEDRMRFLLERNPTDKMSDAMKEMIHGILRMLNRDRDGFVSHFMLHVRKRCHGMRNPKAGDAGVAEPASPGHRLHQ